MLLYEAGYLCNTSANTKYGVSDNFLLNVLHHGKIIHGVRLDKYCELQVYNFRKLNKVRLEAFSNVRFEVDEIDELLQGMRGSIGDSFELCLYARGISSVFYADAEGTIKLNNFLHIEPFISNIVSSNLYFDLRGLSDDKAFVIYSSLIRHIDSGILYFKDIYVPNVIIDETKQDSFLLGTLLLKGATVDCKGDVIYNFGMRKSTVSLFKYWYSYDYTDISIKTGTHIRSYLKDLPDTFVCDSKFLNILHVVLYSGTVAYSMANLGSIYYSLYGKVPSKFKPAFETMYKVLKSKIEE